MMLSGLLPGGQVNLPQTWGFNGPPPDIDPMTGMPMTAPKLAAPQTQPFGPFPGVTLPGLQNDLAQPSAPQPPQGGGSLPPWLAESLAAPTGIGGSAPADIPTPRPRPASAPADDALPAEATLATGPAPMALTPQPPAQSAAGPSVMSRFGNKLLEIASVTSPGARDLLNRNRAQDATNQTFAALVKRGLDPDVASAVVGNPEMLKQILPSLFGGKKLMNVNGVLVDEATGKPVADFSDAQRWQIAKVTDPNTGIENSVLVQPATGATRQITPGALQQATAPGGPAQGGPVTQRMALPPEVRNMPPSLQFKNAPDGSTATLGGRPVVKRNGRWEYVQ